MIGYKAFNKDMTCRCFQFKEGEIYETDKAEICKSGFHFCENPLDVLNYYNLCDSEFAEVEALGETQTHNDDSKVCTTKIKIGAKMDLSGFIKASVNFLLNKEEKQERVVATSGNYSQIATSGNYSQVATSGDNSVGANIGIKGQIKGVLGNWITLAEYKWEGDKCIPCCVKSAQIDGEFLKPNTWYQLQDGEFKEVIND